VGEGKDGGGEECSLSLWQSDLWLNRMACIDTSCNLGTSALETYYSNFIGRQLYAEKCWSTGRVNIGNWMMGIFAWRLGSSTLIGYNSIHLLFASRSLGYNHTMSYSVHQIISTDQNRTLGNLKKERERGKVAGWELTGTIRLIDEKIYIH